MITAELANFAVSSQPGDGARAMMRLSLFDWAICGFAGRDEPVARIVRDMILAEGGAGQAALFGRTERVPARAAALVNGTASHALDYDDTHFAHIGHPSVAVIPAALAVAERQGATGSDFLDACAVGAELSVRVGIWLGRAHYQAGFHQTATAGCFGAAAASGRLMRLDAGQMAHVLGLAATRAAGLKSQFGTMGKPYHAGLGAAAGVEAATLVAAGFVSRPDGIECAQGFGVTHAGEALAEALSDLGTMWHLEKVTHKFHACCHGTHAMLEALAGLAPRLVGEKVDQVEVAVHPRWLSVCNIAAPGTGLEAKFSLKQTAAMALDGVDTARLESFSDAACTAPRLVELRDHVDVIGDETVAETAARVTLRLAGGRRIQGVHDLSAPIAMPDRATKLRGKARALLGDAVMQPFWEAVTTFEAPDLRAFVQCVAGNPARSAPTHRATVRNVV